MTAEMVGAKVIVVRSGTEKSPGTNNGLRGIISAVSQKCYYISYEKLIIDSSPTSLPTLSRSPPSSVLDYPPQSSEMKKVNTRVAPVTISTVLSKVARAVAVEGRESSIQISCDHNNDNLTLMAADTISEDNVPEAINISKSVWKEVIWVKKMMVIKVIKSSSVLAVILPIQQKNPRRGKLTEVVKMLDDTEDESGKMFLLHGAEHMQFSGIS